jgi:hypothetical protein
MQKAPVEGPFSDDDPDFRLLVGQSLVQPAGSTVTASLSTSAMSLQVDVFTTSGCIVRELSWSFTA